MGSPQQPSIGALISRTIVDARKLATAQVDLAKAEVSSQVSRLSGITVLGIIAIALVAQAGLMLTFAVVYALVALGLATWAAFLIVAGVFLLIAGILAAVAYQRAQGFRKPDIAKAELEKTIEAVSSLANPAPSSARST
jgi:hypothetical protein